MKIDEAISLLKQYIDYNNPDIPDFYTMEEACEVVIKALENQPTDAVDRVTIKEYLESYEVAQPKMGRWISYNWNDNGIARWGIKCNQCYKEYRYGGEMGGTYKYCPNCGSDNREAEE